MLARSLAGAFCMASVTGQCGLLVSSLIVFEAQEVADRADRWLVESGGVSLDGFHNLRRSFPAKSGDAGLPILCPFADLLVQGSDLQ